MNYDTEIDYYNNELNRTDYTIDLADFEKEEK